MKRIIPPNEFLGTDWTTETVKGNADNVSDLESIADVDYIATTSAEFEAYGDAAYANKTIFADLDAITLTQWYIQPSGQRIVFKNGATPVTINNGAFGFKTDSSDMNNEVLSYNAGAYDGVWNAATPGWTFTGAQVDAGIVSDASGCYAMCRGQSCSIASATSTTIVLDASPVIRGKHGGSADKVTWVRNPALNISMEGHVKFTGAGVNINLDGSYNADLSRLRMLASSTCSFDCAHGVRLPDIEFLPENALTNMTSLVYFIKAECAYIRSGRVKVANFYYNGATTKVVLSGLQFLDGLLDIEFIDNVNTAAVFKGVNFLANTTHQIVLRGIDKGNTTASDRDNANVGALIV